MAAPPVAEAQDACASDPNFAAIFAFCERFGDSCGVTIPTFQELQEMLEKTDEVPDTLVDLHIKLLRRVKKSVHADKWEKAILKFCQVYSVPEIWELERYGYKGISVKLKLRILKTILEAQFDSNVKFKAEINKLESSTLRSQPLGWDKSGVAYWVQFDRACNLRVYKEDIDEDTWKIVAKDRSTLVNLINDLSGVKDNTLDNIEDGNNSETFSDEENELSSGLDKENYSLTLQNSNTVVEKNEVKLVTTESKVETNSKFLDLKENSLNKQNNLKRKLDENVDEKVNELDCPIVGETIEESIMIVKGEGSGKECDTGNPDEPNTQNDTSKNEDAKKPKLWSIETICSSSKDVKEEVISVPKTGFFFGDDSVSCFNNVSNGESSLVDKDKLETNCTEKNEDKVDCTTALEDNIVVLHEECSTQNKNKVISDKGIKQSVFNIKIHEEEVQITERKANEVFTKSDSNFKNNTDQVSINEPLLVSPHDKPTSSQLNIATQFVESNKDDKYPADKNVSLPKTTDECGLDNDGEKVKCKGVEDSINSAKSNIQRYKSSEVQDNKEDKIKEQLTVQIDDQTIKINNPDNNIIIKKESSKINQKNDEQIKNSHKKDEACVSLSSTKDKCIDIINEQKNINVVENVLKVDQTMSNDADLSDTVTQNQKLVDVQDVLDKNVTKKIDRKVSEDINQQTTNVLETSTTCSNYDLSQHTDQDNSTLSKTDKSRDKEYNKPTESNNLFLKSCKQVDDDQNSTIPKKTLHNIRNIIKTDEGAVSEPIKTNKQSSNTFCNKNKLIKIQPVKNESDNVNSVFPSEKQLITTLNPQSGDTNKHNLEKVFQNADETSENKLVSKSVSSNFKTDKISTEDTEIDKTKIELKMENIVKDSTIIKVGVNPELKINETNFELGKPKNSKEKKTINVMKGQIVDEKIVTKKHTDNKDKVKQENLKLNEGTNKKPNLMDVKNKIDRKENLNSEKLENDLCIKEEISHESLTAVTQSEMNESNSNEMLQKDKSNQNVEDKKSEENNENIISTNNLNLALKCEKDQVTQDLKENKGSKIEEPTVSSPIHEDMYESPDNNYDKETLIDNSKEKCDNDDTIYENNEEDNQNTEEVEDMPKKRGRPGRKKGKRGRAKQITTPIKSENKVTTEEKVKRQYKPRKKKVVTIAEEVTVFSEPEIGDNKRRSRRIAEIKIKEQFIPNAQYDDIDEPIKVSKKKDKVGKKVSTSKKLVNVEESDDEDEDNLTSKKIKKRKRKGKPDSLKKINVVNPWNVDSESSSSENNVGLFEDYDHEEEEEIPRPGIEPNISDHEFSPESDINEDDDYRPEKRARTAHKKDQDEKLDDDMSCRSCNKSDQPEWILLCDTCNQGWHASCLRPALLVIPDGDWYCPPCRHKALLNALKDVLKRYDGESKKRENEELRRKRLAYVGISLQNVISSKTEIAKTEKQPEIRESSEDESESESESYDSEPLYQLRARRQANVSYRFNDYDNMINEAIFEETGIDDNAISKYAEVKKKKIDDDENTNSDSNDSKDREDSPIAPALLHLRGRKKSKKLTNLDISSDDGSDEDFKGPSDGDDDYEEDLSEYSDDSVKMRPQATRRSVRNRKTVVDPNFINDDSSEESDNRSKKRKSRPWSDSSNSEEEDFTWGKKKKKCTNTPSTSSFKFKHSKGSKRKHTDNRNSKKSKIKYGMDSDSDDQPLRKTRGRQITYAESDDSDEESQPKKRKVLKDEEDDYVLNDDELEAENEDVSLETDDEEAVASDVEKEEEEIDNEEEVLDEEEEDEIDKKEEKINKKKETVGNEKKENNIKSPLPDIVEKKIQTSSVQSVIQERISTLPLLMEDTSHSNVVHQRLSPTGSDKHALPQISTNPIVGEQDKRIRSSHQSKKSTLANPSVDYVVGDYPYPPDATKVLSGVPPSSVHVNSFNRPPVTVSNSAGGFKTMTVTASPTSNFLTTPYRTSNKVITDTIVAMPTSPAYHPPQVQRVYESPVQTSYSSYPVDYAASETPLPPPPPTAAFRNVGPLPSNDLSSLPTTMTQQSAIPTTGGESEFGGLVSYFSSQQEDDFDA